MTPERLAEVLEALADGPPWDTAWLRSLLPELAVRGRLVAQEAEIGIASLEAISVAPICYGVLKPGDEDREGVPLIKITDVRDGIVHEGGLYWISQALSDQFERSLVEAGDVLLSIQGTIGRTAVVPPSLSGANISRTLARIRVGDSAVPRWVQIYLDSPATQDEMAGVSVGSTRASLNIGAIRKIEIPLPTLAEQHRIVAKVDELMGHAAVVEDRHLAASSARVRFRDAALHALAEAEDHEAVGEAWSRIEDHFDDLFTEPEDIQPLRQTILQLAVRGRLVAQEAGEPLGESIRPFVSVIGGSTPSKSRSDYWNGQIPWVSPKDMKVLVIRDSEDHITELALEDRTQKVVPTDSVLIVIRGMILAHSFPVAVTSREVTINQDMKALLPQGDVDASWLSVALRGSRREVLGRVERSTHGTCKLALTEVLDLPITVPPLAEQHRIVAKVDELMDLCDTLETSLERAKTTREQFATSISHALTAPESIPA